MKFSRSRNAWIATACLLRFGLMAPCVSVAEGLSAKDVMRKAVARAEHRSAVAGQSAYTYTKVMVTEELDKAGKVKKREEKTYEVLVQAGATSQKLLEVNGKPLAAAELKKQPETETKVYRSLGPAKSGKGDRRETLLTPDLVARFDFTLTGQNPVNGRPAFQLTFQPNTNCPPPRHFMDRLLGRLSGTVWIDAEDFEIARADIGLNSPVDMLGGVLGSLKKMACTLMRTRLADGQWLSASSTGDFEGRKLLDSTHVKTSSRSTDFRPVALR